MRVRLASRRADDERGAVAIIVAVCAIVLFGFAAYAIDAGNLWQTRRNMVTATDAAALASAADYSVGSNGCSSAASFVSLNRADATMDSCSVSGGATTDAGHTTVRAGTNVEYTFAGVFGLTNKQVHSATTAEWGIPSGANGLRPFGLCLHANAQLQSWLNLPAGPTGPSSTIRITYGKSQPDACGSNVPGNWGVQDFDGGANSTSDTKEWTRNGYPGTVSIGANIPGDTGAFSNSLNSELSYLRSSGEFFALPIFDTAAGNGSNSTFHIVAFANVKLVDFLTTGNQANRYLELVFSTGVLSGTCCGSGIDTGVRVVRICDIDTTNPNTSDPRAC
jgi:Flp pilus assembly protein TadG